MTTDPRIAPLAAALSVAITWDKRYPQNVDIDATAAAILAALAEAGWTLAPIQSPVTNDPPPRLVTELYP